MSDYTQEVIEAIAAGDFEGEEAEAILIGAMFFDGLDEDEDEA